MVSAVHPSELWAVRIGLTFRDGQDAFAAVLERVLPMYTPGDNGLSQ